MDTTMREARPQAAPRCFYGWVVVGGAFLVLLVGFGIAYSFAAFFRPLEEQFAATRGAISLVFSITGFLYFTLGAVSGPIADRIGPRRVVACGVLLIGVGLLLASRATQLWQVYLTYSLGVGLGVGFVYVPSVGAVQRWFTRRRGFASGLAVAGIGVGTLAMPPLAARLIGLGGWRVTYVLLALLALAVGLVAARLIEHSPQRRGLLPDGDGTERAHGDPSRAGVPGGALVAGARPGPSAPAFSLTPAFTTRAAVRSRPFALLYTALVTTSLGLFIPFAHLAPYARDHGLSEVAGAWLVGLIGLGSAGGRLVLGGAADRLGRRRSLGAMFAGMAIMLLWWLGAAQFWSLAAFALLFGLCYGGFVALVPALTTDYFGGRNAGGIIGILYTGAGVGALLGPWLAGWIYDASQSYTIPIAFAALANLVALACMVAIDDPRRLPPSLLEKGGRGEVFRKK